MLKTLARSHGGCGTIKEYLEREGRALTFDCAAWVDPTSWDADFDSVRKAYGKDSGRKYYHFVISPDPEDGLDAEAVRALALEWVDKRYKDSQWVVETHVDNGIPHAHIVVNSVNLASGLKVHLSNSDVQMDAATLQAICKSRGLSAFDNYRLEKSDEGEWVAKTPVPVKDNEAAQRRAREAARARRRNQAWMRAKGIHLWTDDVHDAVERALQGCCSWQAFERELEKQGYEARVSRRGVLTFYPKEGVEGHPIKGYKVDESYTVEGIHARLRPVLGPRRTKGVLSHSMQPRSVLKQRTSFAKVAGAQANRAYRNGKIDNLQGCLDAIAVAKANGFTSWEQVARAAEEAKRRADEVAEDLEAAKLSLEHIDEAAKRVIRRESLKNRIGEAPRSGLFKKRWLDSNRDELEWIRDIDAWLEEHGLQPATTLEDIQGMRTSLRRDVMEIDARASQLVEEAQALSRAARAVGEIPTLPKGTMTWREAEKTAAPAIRLADAMASGDLGQMMKDHIERARKNAERMALGMSVDPNLSIVADEAERRLALRAEESRASKRAKMGIRLRAKERPRTEGQGVSVDDQGRIQPLTKSSGVRI